MVEPDVYCKNAVASGSITAAATAAARFAVELICGEPVENAAGALVGHSRARLEARSAAVSPTGRAVVRQSGQAAQLWARRSSLGG